MKLHEKHMLSSPAPTRLFRTTWCTSSRLQQTAILTTFLLLLGWHCIVAQEAVCPPGTHKYIQLNSTISIDGFFLRYSLLGGLDLFPIENYKVYESQELHLLALLSNTNFLRVSVNISAQLDVLDFDVYETQAQVPSNLKFKCATKKNLYFYTRDEYFITIYKYRTLPGNNSLQGKSLSSAIANAAVMTTYVEAITIPNNLSSPVGTSRSTSTVQTNFDCGRDVIHVMTPHSLGVAVTTYDEDFLQLTVPKVIRLNNPDIDTYIYADNTNRSVIVTTEQETIICGLHAYEVLGSCRMAANLSTKLQSLGKDIVLQEGKSQLFTAGCAVFAYTEGTRATQRLAYYNFERDRVYFIPSISVNQNTIAVNVDNHTNLYVTDSKVAAMYKYDPDGQSLYSIQLNIKESLLTPDSSGAVYTFNKPELSLLKYSYDACQDCKVGTVAAVPDSLYCQACEQGSESNEVRTSCLPCKPGYMNSKQGSTCTICPDGQYSSYPSSRECSLCPPGYVPNESKTNCTICAPGSFSLGYGTSACVLCPNGTVSTEYGATDILSCQSCPAGYYADGVGASSCIKCPAGSYLEFPSFAVGANSHRFCKLCPKGFYSPTEGATSIESCIPCGESTFGPQEGASKCVSCPISTYSSALGSTVPQTCRSCPAGTWSNRTGSIALDTCYPCGYGTYSSAVGATSENTCVPCPKGTFSNVLGADNASYCLDCPVGSYASGLAIKKCTPCPEGTFSTVEGAFSSEVCLRCPRGTYASPNRSNCLPCPLGYFTSYEGSSSCLRIPEGAITLESGASFQYCQIGTFANANQTECVPCLPGHFCQEGLIAPCDDGSISKTAGASKCEKCLLGFEPSRDRTICQIQSGFIISLVLGIFAAVLLVIMIIIVIRCILKRKQKRKRAQELEHALLSPLPQEGDFSAQIFQKFNRAWEVNFEELSDFEEIASGGSGAIVFKAKWKGRNVALKMFRAQMFTDTEGIEAFIHELQLMSTLRDKNIVYFYGATCKIPRIGIVTEYCRHGTLREYVTRQKPLSWQKKLDLALEIAHGLRYLHSVNVMHRDLKADNILIDDNGHAKIADFNISTMLSDHENAKYTVRVGTSIYMAPEVARGETYNEKCDVFSFAIILYEILTENFKPYEQIEKQSKLSAIDIAVAVAQNPTMRPMIPLQAWTKSQLHYIDLMVRCWEHDASHRPSFETICKELDRCYILQYEA